MRQFRTPGSARGNQVFGPASIHTAMKKSIRTVACGILGILTLFAVGLGLSRHRAIKRADAFMTEHFPEKWYRGNRRLVLFTNDRWTPLWCVGYEADALTTAPPSVYVSLGGSMLGSNFSTSAGKE